MSQSRAVVPTEHASRYLQQLCKHWSHKFTVDFTPTHGEIELPAGKTVLDATDSDLTVTIHASDAASLDQLEAVVADHIVRFAFREELSFAWTRSAAA